MLLFHALTFLLLHPDLDGIQANYGYPGYNLSLRSGLLRDYFDIFSSAHIHYSLFHRSDPTISSPFSFIRFSDISAAEMSWLVHNGPLEYWTAQGNIMRCKERLAAYSFAATSRSSQFPSVLAFSREEKAGGGETTVIDGDNVNHSYPAAPINNRALFLITSFTGLSPSNDLLTPIATRRLVHRSPEERLEELQHLIRSVRYFMPKVSNYFCRPLFIPGYLLFFWRMPHTINCVVTKALAGPIELYCSNKRFLWQQQDIMHNQWAKRYARANTHCVCVGQYTSGWRSHNCR